MSWKSLDCPRCNRRYQFFLTPDLEQHLRRCPKCDRWFVVQTEPTDPREYRLELLDYPPTCPVDGCDKVVQPDELPPHILTKHDGKLSGGI